MTDFPGIVTSFARGLRSKIAASTVTSAKHRLYTDEGGGLRIGDGASQIRKLLPFTPTVDTIASLRASLGTFDHVLVRGYYAVGDGGGGKFRWDTSEHATTDNGGTIIVPTNGTLAGLGRWKRVYDDGPLNVRWFGANPSQTDNTQTIQNAINWLVATASPGTSTTGGTLLFPFGTYQCLFDQGTSGLATITINGDNIVIEGEGAGTQLLVRSTYTGQVPYFLTFKQLKRGGGGGVRHIRFLGGNTGGVSRLQWGVRVNSWRNWEMNNVKGTDLLGGLLDVWNNNTDVGADNTEGENIRVRGCDYSYSSGTNSAYPQYGIRFKAGITGSYSDCSVRDSLFIGVWDSGVMLDGVHRIRISNVSCANNGSSSNTLDGSTKTGCMHGVTITNTFVDSVTTGDCGRHIIDAVHCESHQGIETPDIYSAIFIDTPATGIDATGATVTQAGSNRQNKIGRIGITPITTTNVRAGTGQAFLKITNGTGVPAQAEGNTFAQQRGDFRAFNGGQIILGANVYRTNLLLDPDDGTLSSLKDVPANYTQINYHAAVSLSGAAPANGTGTAAVDVGQHFRDIDSGRLWVMDRHNIPVLIGPQHGNDIVSARGAQQIKAMSTPTAPLPANKGPLGSTTYTYYVVAVDKDGNKSIPSAAGTFGSGPASLTGSPNIIKWAPVVGAVTYDLLKADTAHSLATGLTTCWFSDDGSITTSAYTASAVNPRGTLVVDDHVTLAGATTPTIATGAAIGTGGAPTATISGSDQDGLIHIVAGTTTLVSGVMATVTFGKTFATAPRCVMLARADNGAITNIYADRSTVTTTGFTVTTSSAPTSSASYWIWYHVGA